MVDDLGVVLVEARRQVRLRHRQAHGVADTLTQRACEIGTLQVVIRQSLVGGERCRECRSWRSWTVGEWSGGAGGVRTGGDLNTRGQEVLGVTRGLALPLAELLQVVDLQGHCDRGQPRPASIYLEPPSAEQHHGRRF